MMILMHFLSSFDSLQPLAQPQLNNFTLWPNSNCRFCWSFWFFFCFCLVHDFFLFGCNATFSSFNFSQRLPRHTRSGQSFAMPDKSVYIDFLQSIIKQPANSQNVELLIKLIDAFHQVGFDFSLVEPQADIMESSIFFRWRCGQRSSRSWIFLLYSVPLFE